MTPAQNAAIKADIAANADLNAFPNTSDGNSEIAALYNAPAVPDFYVWRTNVPTAEVFDQIIWANLTPIDVPDTTQAWMNRSLACQGKQFNLQTILTGRDKIDASKANIRAGFQDALTAIPSGVGGANKQAGWANLQTALSRKATRLEKLLATGTGTQATPATMGFEGSVNYGDIGAARA